jgi:uncharacterized BrkB/YihY/UPF0761 family membrane protein
MRLNRPLYLLLLIFITSLVFISGCLFKRTIDYQQANRELILQNDSLKAVVIDLNRKIEAANSVGLSSPRLAK